jgi:hypothetical protein
MPYAILLNELKPLDLQKVARILAKAEDIIYADATRIVRNCCGFLAENLPFQEARSISDELNREGVGVFYMEHSKMLCPPPPLNIHNADCRENCFDLEDMYGRHDPLSWENIVLLSVGRVVERKERGGIGGADAGGTLSTIVGAAMWGVPGISRGRAPGQSPSVTPRKVTEEERLILDIFSRKPQERHYRILQKGFNYDYLGSRLTPNSSANFCFLVEDLVGFAKEAYGNRGINAYLSGQEPQKIDYGSLDLFDKENLWLLQLIHLNVAQSQEGEPEG